MQKNYNVFLFILLVIFISGCIFKKKDQQEKINQSPFLFNVVTKIEKISQDDAKILGFIFLPLTLETSIGKKNDNFYMFDSFYKSSIESFDASYQLLKNLYIQDGWTFIDEVFSNIYINAFLKKEDKEIALFIQEKEIYNKETLKFEKQVLLHQSLLLI
jgi:hypothetical protein